MFGNDKRPFLILLALFTLVACSLAALPLYVYQQFIHLAQHDDTRLVEQTWQPTFSQPLCLFVLKQNQKTRSETAESNVWNRVAVQWESQPGSYFGQHDEAYYQHNLRQGLTIRSSVFAQNTQPLATFIVNNQLIIDLPPHFCNPFS